MFKLFYSTPRIIATIGPSCSSLETLGQMIRGGMYMARFNFSHGTKHEKQQQLDLLKGAEKNEGVKVFTFADLCGPKIRVGRIRDGACLLQEGGTVQIFPYEVLGDSDGFSVGYEHLADEVKRSTKILLDDGKLELEVDFCTNGIVTAKVLRGGTLYEHKGVNVPGAFTKLPILTEKDKGDLEYAISYGCDAVAVSFVRTGEDLQYVTKYMVDTFTKTIPIIAKIETEESLTHIDAIMKHADALMVARGDLGVEIGLSHVPLWQKEICMKARVAGKPVIVATQLLQSMKEAETPTRAEVSDVVNAILDGASYLMLSDETTVGMHPVVAVQAMADIITHYNDVSIDESA